MPLEPSLPRKRLEGMLDAAGVSIVITDRGAVWSNYPQTGATLIDLDADRAGHRLSESENPSVRVHGENLAYVVFTSGSTGRPKGVMVAHRGLLGAAAAWEQAYDLCRPPLRHLQAAGFAFDVFTGDWVPRPDHRRNACCLPSGGLARPGRAGRSHFAANGSSVSSSSRRLPTLWRRTSSGTVRTWARSGCSPSARTHCAEAVPAGSGG